MAISPSSPITGTAQTGLTTPTYTITSDVAPTPNGKQWAVTSLGGTQSGVDIHSVSKPFTMTFFRPAVLKPVPAPSPVTGIVKNVPVNKYLFITRKGASPLVNQAALTVMVRTEISVPAGCDTYEPEDVRAALAAHFGFLNSNSSAIGDTCITGIL